MIEHNYQPYDYFESPVHICTNCNLMKGPNGIFKLKLNQFYHEEPTCNEMIIKGIIE